MIINENNYYVKIQKADSSQLKKTIIFLRWPAIMVLSNSSP